MGSPRDEFFEELLALEDQAIQTLLKPRQDQPPYEPPSGGYTPDEPPSGGDPRGNLAQAVPPPPRRYTRKALATATLTVADRTGHREWLPGVAANTDADAVLRRGAIQRALSDALSRGQSPKRHVPQYFELVWLWITIWQEWADIPQHKRESESAWKQRWYAAYIDRTPGEPAPDPDTTTSEAGVQAPVESDTPALEDDAANDAPPADGLPGRSGHAGAPTAAALTSDHETPPGQPWWARQPRWARTLLPGVVLVILVVAAYVTIRGIGSDSTSPSEAAILSPSASTSASSPTPNTSTSAAILRVQAEERTGFMSLVNGDLAQASMHFKKAYTAYPTWHNVDEIHRLLAAADLNRYAGSSPSEKWKYLRPIFQQVVDNYSWGAPPEVLIQMNARLKGA